MDGCVFRIHHYEVRRRKKERKKEEEEDEQERERERGRISTYEAAKDCLL
jgi:hypothetical protein